MLASRSKQNIHDYENAIAWLKKTAEHLEKIAEEKSKPEDWTKYQEIRKKAIVLLERLDKANREHLYPALADGQGAIVVDVDARSKKWFDKMPESPKPLPMFELGFAGSVSDAEHLRQGVAAYIDIAVETYKLIKEYNPKEMPELKLPEANVSDRQPADLISSSSDSRTEMSSSTTNTMPLGSGMEMARAPRGAIDRPTVYGGRTTFS